jgi:soluble lytic murein transglycosylase-like protein
MSIVLGFAAIVAAQPAPDVPREPDPLAPLEEPVESRAPEPPPPPVSTAPVAPQQPVIVPRDWGGVFAAIRAGQWASASAGIAALPPSPLSATARAELFLARNSPVAPVGAIVDLLLGAPELPQAERLQRLADTRGAEQPPPVARRALLVPIGSTPRRGRARPVSGEPEADRLRTDLEALIKADDFAGAEALLLERAPLLSTEARAEAGQRVAWIYYTSGQDAEARRVAETWRVGAAGEWGQQSAWVSGLASWRLGDCSAAARSFREVGTAARELNFAAAGYYWAARSEMACRRPAAVEPLLRAAARSTETFYGLIARRTLGLDTRLVPLTAGPNARVEALPNVQRAVELVRIGERDLAGEHLRHQARLGSPADHAGLVAVAKRLDLPATQHFLAHFGQPGAQVPAAARYPKPNWAPRNGWRIDPALAFAHALQESNFRSEAVSQAGAVGLMQVLPSTRDLIARNRGIASGDLRDPATNMTFGQAWIEWMKTHNATQGHLPKVVASYNAGPLPVGRWRVNDRGDPLLWIESMPFWETRFYVPAVMRNMWVYQGFDNAPTPTLTQMAQHQWPTIPPRR